jgi:hypothetical protein
MQRSTSHLLFDLRLHVCVPHAAGPGAGRCTCCSSSSLSPASPSMLRSASPVPPSAAAARRALPHRCRSPQPEHALLASGRPLLRRAPPPPQAQRTSRANESGRAAARPGGWRALAARDARPDERRLSGKPRKTAHGKNASQSRCLRGILASRPAGRRARMRCLAQRFMKEAPPPLLLLRMCMRTSAGTLSAVVSEGYRTSRVSLREVPPPPPPLPLCCVRRACSGAYGMCAAVRRLASRPGAHTINRTRRGSSCRCRSVAVRASAVGLGGARWSCMDVSGLRLPADRYLYIGMCVARARVLVSASVLPALLSNHRISTKDCLC